MGHDCKGKCDKLYPYKKSGVSGGVRGWVENGYRQCSKCEFILLTDTRNCRCCGTQFRWRKKGPTRHLAIITVIAEK